MKTLTLSLLLAASVTSLMAQEHAEMKYVASDAQFKLEKAPKKDKISLSVSNPNAVAYPDAPVCVQLPALNKYKSATVYLVKADGTRQEIASQMDDLNGDGVKDELALVVDLEASATAQLEVQFSKKDLGERYTPRVFSEMRMRVNKGKGSRTIDLKDVNYRIDTISEIADTKYSEVFPHGLCFENEFMGYRVYFNASHGTDLYGKRVRQLELERSMWYTPEIRDSAAVYNYGEDFIIVGQTATVGTLRGWDDAADDKNYLNTSSGAKVKDPCMVKVEPFKWRQAHLVAKGPVRTVADMNVEGWNYKGHELNMKNRYVLYAGNREHYIINQLESVDGKPLSDLEFVTGVMKVGSLNHDSLDIAILRYEADGKGFCASYGKDWPDGNRKHFPYMSKAGLAVSLPQANVTRQIDRREQILYGLKLNADGSIIYRAAAAAPDLETFAPTANGRWDYEKWFKWARQWNEMKPATVSIAE